jgi:hypothetical protein
MELLKDLEVVGNYPVAYFKSIDCLVFADLHLGYEGIAAEQGIFLPKVQFKEIVEIMQDVLKIKKCKNVLINGDIKHEFSETSYHEFREVRDFFNILKEKFKRVILIKGNHDNYIYYVTKKVGVELYDSLKIKNYFFFHGHQPVSLRETKAEILIVAHEHPVIALVDELGTKEVVKCFLWGKTKLNNLVIVLPALSTLSYGTEMNSVLKEELLSPFLKTWVELDELNAVGIDKEVGVMEFGKIKKLRL